MAPLRMSFRLLSAALLLCLLMLVGRSFAGSSELPGLPPGYAAPEVTEVSMCENWPSLGGLFNAPFPDEEYARHMLQTLPKLRDQLEVSIRTYSIFKRPEFKPEPNESYESILSRVLIAGHLALYNGKFQDAYLIGLATGHAGLPLAVRALTITSFLPLPPSAEDPLGEERRKAWGKEAAELIADEEFADIQGIPELVMWAVYARIKDLDMRKEDMGGVQTQMEAFRKVYELCGEHCQKSVAVGLPDGSLPLRVMKLGLQAGYLSKFKDTSGGTSTAGWIKGGLMGIVKKATDAVGATYTFNEEEVMSTLKSIKPATLAMSIEFACGDALRKIGRVQEAVASYGIVKGAKPVSAEELVYRRTSITRCKLYETGDKDALAGRANLIPRVWRTSK